MAEPMRPRPGRGSLRPTGFRARGRSTDPSSGPSTRRTSGIRISRQRARAAGPVVPLTADQYEAARLGHPGLTPDEAAYYVHVSERYVYDLELWSRDAMPVDPAAEDRERVLAYAEERQAPGGRIRHAINRRESERISRPYRRYDALTWGEAEPHCWPPF